MNAVAPVIPDAEPLANFVVESSKFEHDGVSWRSFLPGKDGQRSVFRVAGMLNAAIAVLGQTEVGNPRNKTIKGWAIVTAGIVRTYPPLIVRDDPPPERHAAIEGWPTAPQDRKTLAMSLASKATTNRCPEA